ncbi:MAG TPA: Flp family type IVb pilin [Arthrobacter sp.]
MNPLFATFFSFLETTKNRLASEEKGATAVEYGLLVGLIAVAIIAALVILGPQLANLFTSVTNSLPKPA